MTQEVSALTSLPSLKEIQSLEEALHRPAIRRSRDAVEALLADGFMEFGASGKVYDRSETIDLLVQTNSADEGDIRAAGFALKGLANDAVLLTYESERLFPDGTRRRTLRSSIWTHDGCRWRMIFHQGTVRA
jgi:hypothetical protein